MSEEYTYGSQHGNPQPIAEDSYLAMWAQAQQEQYDAEQQRIAQELADQMKES